MSQYNTSKCIFPDGVTNGNINPPFVPCDPLASVSACCAIGESCVGEGLCYSANGGIYRGACTDATWKDPACPKYCVAKSGDQASYQSAFQFLYQCLIDGDTTQWSCLNANTCGKGNLFELFPHAIQQLNISGLADSAAKQSAAIKSAWAPISNAATLSSVTPAPSVPGGSNNDVAGSSSAACANARCDDKAVAIGAGVGVPLAILLLAAVVGMFFYRRKWVQERNARGSGLAASHPGYLQSYEVPSSPTANVAGYGHGGIAYKRVVPSELSDSWPAAREVSEMR